MKFDVGDIVVIGGYSETAEDFAEFAVMNTKSVYNKPHSVESEIFSDIYMLIGEVGFSFEDKRIKKVCVDIETEPKEKFFDFMLFEEELRLATEHEKFLYYMYGSNALKGKENV